MTVLALKREARAVAAVASDVQRDINVKPVLPIVVNNGGIPRLAYSVEEAAAILGVSQKTVRRLIARGGLLVPSNGIRHLLIPVWSLVKYLESTSGGFESIDERKLHLSLLYEVLCRSQVQPKSFSTPDEFKSYEGKDFKTTSAS